MCHLYPYNNVKLLRKFFTLISRYNQIFGKNSPVFNAQVEDDPVEISMSCGSKSINYSMTFNMAARGWMEIIILIINKIK